MKTPVPSCRPEVESLEDRTAPASLIVSQVNPAALPPVVLPASCVSMLLQRAAAATTSDDAIVAVVDRAGNILGVRVEANVSPVITGNSALRDFSIDGAVALARAGAFFSSDVQALTSRTVGFISQTTITQRMVDSSFYVADQNSGAYGPGFVARVGLGGNFPPGVQFTPLVDLFGIEFTNRVSKPELPPAYSYAAYGDVINDPGLDPTIARPLPSRGIGTLPGGLPIYLHGVLVGGIGVFFPGTTGYASAENSSLSADYDPSKPDRSLEAEFIALAAVGGSQQAGLPIGPLQGVQVCTDSLPFQRIELAGITLDGVGQGGDQGPFNLVKYAQGHFAIGQGSKNSGANQQIDPNPAHTLKAGVSAPFGWLVAPHSGGGITAAQVTQIVQQGIAEAGATRAQIRPLGFTTRMVFSVADAAGDILGVYRMRDATVFSIDVAMAKSRNVAYYDNPNELLTADHVGGLPVGASFTARTFRFLAQAFYPEGQEGSPPGVWSPLNDPGINPFNGLQIGPALPASSYTSEVGFAAFHPRANFHFSTAPTKANGVVFFPGSAGVYVTIGGTRTILGGLGVSGDGVNQDDFVTFGADAFFAPPDYLRADQFAFRNIRLPYLKFPRNPLDI